MKHSLHRVHTGSGITGEIQPTCSCGWKGRAIPAHNDWQHANVAEQETEHLYRAEKMEAIESNL